VTNVFRLILFIARSSARALHDHRSVPLAFRNRLLPVQDIFDGNDVIGIDSDHSGVHHRALPGDLSFPAGASDFRSVARRSLRRRRLDCRQRDGGRLPDPHAHFLLRHRSTVGGYRDVIDRDFAGRQWRSCAFSAAARRLVDMHYSDRVDAEHDIRLSGQCLMIR